MSIISAIWKLKKVVPITPKNYDELKKVTNLVDSFIKNKQVVLSKKQTKIFNQQKNEIKRFEDSLEAVPTETKADILPFQYKKTFKQEIEEMGKKSEVVEKYPLQDIKDRVRPGSMLDDLAKKDPEAARQHIRNMDITDQHLAFINTGKINYKQMEKLLQTKLKGTETWDELKAIQKRKFPDPPEDLASGGRIGMAIGGFTKAQVLIQMLKNTIKGSKDPYVKKNFPNFIKELQKNPELALDENVWKQFTTGLPKNQRLVVHSDDSVDFFTQSEFGPHNIEKTLEFQKKHNLSREQALKLLHMEPEDRVLEMKRLKTIADRTKPVVASSDEYLEALDKRIMDEMDLTKADLENMSSTALDDLRRSADPIGMQKHFDEITEGRGVGDFADDPSFLRDEKQTEIFEKFDVKGRKKNASGGLAYMLGEPTYSDGGRTGFRRGTPRRPSGTVRN